MELACPLGWCTPPARRHGLRKTIHLWSLKWPVLILSSQVVSQRGWNRSTIQLTPTTVAVPFFQCIGRVHIVTTAAVASRSRTFDELTRPAATGGIDTSGEFAHASAALGSIRLGSDILVIGPFLSIYGNLLLLHPLFMPTSVVLTSTLTAAFWAWHGNIGIPIGVRDIRVFFPLSCVLGQLRICSGWCFIYTGKKYCDDNQDESHGWMQTKLSFITKHYRMVLVKQVFTKNWRKNLKFNVVIHCMIFLTGMACMEPPLFWIKAHVEWKQESKHDDGARRMHSH